MFCAMMPGCTTSAPLAKTSQFRRPAITQKAVVNRIEVTGKAIVIAEARFTALTIMPAVCRRPTYAKNDKQQ